MATTLRSEISKSNPYWIERQRYYELKHFCLQYPIWKKIYSAFDGASKTQIEQVKKTGFGDPTFQCASKRERYINWIRIVEQAASNTDEILGFFVLRGVTEGWSYDILKARLEIPCGKDMYYNLYRKFFWILDSLRE